jgi:hypothetical protein
VLNIIEYDIRHKRSYLLGQSQRVIFRPEDVADGDGNGVVQAAEDFTDYLGIAMEDMEYPRVTDRVYLNAPVTGTGAYHFWWDNKGKGGTYIPYSGKLACDSIKPMCFLVSNPKCEDVQKQQHVVLACREETEYVREMARADGSDAKTVKAIRPDSLTTDPKYDTEEVEQLNTDMTTFLIHYYRKDGEVWWEKCTKDAKIVKPKWMNGNKLYPVVVVNWIEREGCIYGNSEVEGLIPAQKAINTMWALNLLATQNFSSPKIILEPGALGNQRITNVVGEILTNYSGDANGIRYLNPPPFSGEPVRLTDSLITLVRTLKGVTEVISADRMVSDMAAAAIIALQNQAKIPLEFQQQRRQRCDEQSARIIEEFAKNFQTIKRPFMVNNAMNEPQLKVFQGDKHKNTTFKLQIEVGPSSNYSESLNQSTLDRVYMEKSDIDLLTYLEFSSPHTISRKEELIRLLKNQKEQSGLIEQMIQGGDISPESAAILAEAGVFPREIGMIASEMAAQAAQMPQEQGAGEMPPTEGGEPGNAVEIGQE